MYFMMLKDHFIVSVIVAVIFYPVFGLDVWIIFAAGFLTDIDHYLIYAFRYKDLKVKNAYEFFTKIEKGDDFYPVFHMAEVVLVFLFMGFYFRIALLIFIGLLSHILLDFLEEKFVRSTNRNFSLIRNVVSSR